jgi:HPt (histidine-containing phosphotransfer) domain-containing protein
MRIRMCRCRRIGAGTDLFLRNLSFGRADLIACTIAYSTHSNVPNGISSDWRPESNGKGDFVPEANPFESDVLLRLNELQHETDRECVLELIDCYCEEAPKLIRAIESAAQSGDGRSLAAAAHTLKGSSLNLGAGKMGMLCRNFEELGKSADVLSASVDVKDITDELEHLKAIFDRFKQEKA